MSKHYASNKDFNVVVANLVKSGWRYQPAGNSKYAKVIAPNGRRMSVPYSLGDWRAIKNFRRDAAHLAALPSSKVVPA
ncbi:hypothetical protein [Burkholderia gladioli]|uniref:hypothetical protein n=1 Tax=Burkholderia gladioli TaxID=28095 RepID=UPI00163E6D90|nr:hypothetical protein [Burkholderia gladioli]